MPPGMALRRLALGFATVPRKYRPMFCRECGEPPREGEPLSWRGLHIECAEKRMWENNLEISRHSGPAFQKQRLRTLKAWGGVPVESLPIER